MISKIAKLFFFFKENHRQEMLRNKTIELRGRKSIMLRAVLNVWS